MPTNRRRRRHYRVKLDEVMEAHELALTLGGLPGIREIGAIESAIARPYCGYYRSIEKKATALVQSLACNHGFIDGNKRTGLFMMVLLLYRSGYRLRASDNLNIETETMIVDLVEHKLSFEDVVVWLKQRLVRT